MRCARAQALIFVIYTLDIVFNFRTAYIDENYYPVLNGHFIALRYLRRWFLFDLIAALPVPLALQLTQPARTQMVRRSRKDVRVPSRR